ncbi:hypothetical protein EFK50_07675 [Nocardioides marmoriginsengisoli]|uniref:Uncharacterized protein n=1 Tax=Nocardioides marmoriginsengisoli TaxID=661483 RepID=A0A3N0CLP2_9ACTN|nr:hypothetical protein [Nocardioides marmoriginsengisoli]RNL64394.1 hypothetical protein EFK50_07675 [Nocardioides marmoriginsengisoli]
MSKYVIYLTTEASIAIEVEADSLEEAQDAAFDELPSGVCAQCSGWGSAWSLDLGDFEVDESHHSVDGEWVEVKKA